MNPDAMIRWTTWDTQIAKIFCQEMNWSEEERDEAIKQYFAVRSLANWDPANIEASLQVVRDYEAIKEAHERGEVDAARFSRIHLAFHLGGVGNSIEHDLTEKYRDDDVMTWPEMLHLTPFCPN